MFTRDPARPDLLAVRSGGACISLIGFIAIAIGPCLFFLHTLPGSEVTPTVGVVIGCIVLFVGLLFMFLRSPCSFDRRRRVIIDETKFIFTLRSKETPFDWYQEVEIRKEVRRSKNNTYTVYPVALKGQTTRNMETSQKYEASRQAAETLAQFMQLPLVDYSTGTAVRREHDQLNEPLAERLRRTGEPIDVPEEPHGSPVTISQSSSELQLEIPKGRGNLVVKIVLLLLPFIIFSTIAPVIFLSVFTKKGPPPIFAVGILLFMAVPICIAMIAVFRRSPAPQVVTFNSRDCRVEVKRPFFGETHVLPTDEIEELVNIKTEGANHPMAFLVPGRGLALRTDKKTIEIGGGLDEDVKAYMEARILQFFVERC